MGWRRLAGLSLSALSVLFGAFLAWTAWRAFGEMRDYWPVTAIRDDAFLAMALFQAAVGLSLLFMGGGQLFNQVRERETPPSLGLQLRRIAGGWVVFIALLALVMLTMTMAAPPELACPRPAPEINTGPADTAPPTIACVGTLLGAAMDIYGLPSFLSQLGLTAFALAVGLRLLLGRMLPEPTLGSAALASAICVMAVAMGELPRAVSMSLGVVGLGIVAMLCVSLACERLTAKS